MLGWDVDVREKVRVHEAVVACRVRLGDPDVFVHVEGYDVFEADAPGFVCADEVGVHFFRAAAGWEAQDEGLFGGGRPVEDAF